MLGGAHDEPLAPPVRDEPHRRARQHARAQKDGAAAAAAEGGKRTRYPHPELAPLALEVLGRLGEQAVAFAHTWATRDPRQRNTAIAELYALWSATLQRHNADLLVSAVGV